MYFRKNKLLSKLQGLIIATTIHAASGCNAIAVEEQLWGLQYNRITTADKQLVHTLKVAPEKFSIELITAHNLNQELATVDSIAKNSDAIAAVNAGFFQVHTNHTTSPAGILKQQNMWHGISYRKRGAIAWQPLNNFVLLDRIQSKSSIRINQKYYPINLLNKPYQKNKSLLYSSTNAKEISIPNTEHRVNYIIQDNKIARIIQTGQIIKHKSDSQFYTRILLPNNSYLFSMVFKNNIIAKQQMKLIQLSDPAHINIQISPQFNRTRKDIQNWNTAPYIVGGTPLLIKNTKKIPNYQYEKLNKDFINNQYARTAIGILKDNNWLFVVVEQNKLLDRAGMTLAELADFMLQQGCYDAINLDGGSSSDFYLKGKTSSNFHHLTSRPVANAIVIKRIALP
jgi:exopolysaccharide biosynthesis protein